MLELVYPVDTAPVLRGSGHSRAAEMLPIVDESGAVTAQASRKYCHSGAKPLHPVVHLHIIDRQGRIYLQQRGADKDLLPLRWDTAVGGHVSYGEYINEALHRETYEELHLSDYNPIGILNYIFESETERELVNVFAVVGDFEPIPDRSELEGGRYWTIEEIEASIGKEIFTPNFEGEYFKVKDTLLALL